VNSELSSTTSRASLAAAEQPTPCARSHIVEDRRTLGLGSSMALVLGSIIGVGIFLNPRIVATASPNVLVYLGFWVLGGLVAAAGAQVYAELGSLFPRAGGEYVFLDKAFGRPVAFAWGWMSFFAGFSGSIAAFAAGMIATLSSTAIGGWLAWPVVSVGSLVLTWGHVLAVGVIWITTLINCRSVSLSGLFQMVLTWTPIAVFLAVGLWAFFSGHVDLISPAQTADPLAPQLELGNIAAAFCAVFFTYTGWNVLVYIGGEVRTPGRTIPAAIMAALLIATAIYLILNLAFVAVVPLSRLPEVPNVGVVVAQYFFGPAGASVFAVLMAMALTGGINVTTMAGSRICLAMARDGYLWSRMADTHPVNRTPVVALVVQGLLTTILVLTEEFQYLMTLTGSVMLLLCCVTISSLFIFRHKLKLQSPYQSFAYPYTPLFFLTVGIVVLVLGLVTDLTNFIAGVAFFVGLTVVNRVFFSGRARPSRT
jgi:basic amino acid/polyamine antiporter, APA family